MKQYNRVNILFLLVVIVLSGCTPAQTEIDESLEVTFHKLLDIDDLNKSLEMYAESTTNRNFKSGSDIRIVLQNLSGQEIYFPLGYGIRLFIVRDNDWMEIQNKNEYFGDGSLLRPKVEQELGDRISTGVRPVLPSPTESKMPSEFVRIVVVGELMVGGEKTGTPVAAFEDVFVDR